MRHFIVYVTIGLASAALDYGIFLGVYALCPVVVIAVFCARLMSLCFNYGLLYHVAFQSELSHRAIFPKYVLLVFCAGIVVSLLIKSLLSLGIEVWLAKLLAELLTFLINFVLQRYAVFRANSSR